MTITEAIAAIETGARVELHRPSFSGSSTPSVASRNASAEVASRDRGEWTVRVFARGSDSGNLGDHEFGASAAEADQLERAGAVRVR
jgi:hypothetical protein